MAKTIQTVFGNTLPGIISNFETQFSTLLSNNILSVRWVANDLDRIGNLELSLAVETDDEGSTITQAYEFNVFLGASLAAVQAEAQAFIDANPTFFFGEALVGFLANPKRTEKYVIGLIYNQSESDGAANYRSIGGADFDGWNTVSSGIYTALPDSISRILVSDTSAFSVHEPLEYEQAGVLKYGVVDAIVADTHIDVRGAPLTLAVTIDRLRRGLPEKVTQLKYNVAGTWGDGVDADLLLNDTGFPDIWYGPTAFLVSMQTFTRVADSTSAPQVNVDIDGSPVFTEDSGNGPAVGAAFAETSIVGVDVATYQIDTNNTIELPCTVAGGTGDAEDLTVIAEVVVP